MRCALELTLDADADAQEFCVLKVLQERVFIMFCEANLGTAEARGLRVVRVPSGAVVRVVVQSVGGETVSSHWFGRQVLCPGVGCPACGHQSVRVAVFLVGLVETCGKYGPCLLELAAGSYSRVRMLAQMEGFEVGPGLVLELSRRHSRAPLRAEPVEGCGKISERLGEEDVLLDAVSILYRLPLRSGFGSMKEWLDAARAVAMSAIEKAVATVG